jgi:hypothetical protein
MTSHLLLVREDSRSRKHSEFGVGQFAEIASDLKR